MNNVKFAFGPMNVTLSGNEIKAGDNAPDFTVMNNDLQPTKLTDYAGKKKILSIFPSVDTPVCAAQNRNFNKLVSEMDNTVVLSISNDLPFAQKRFCGAEGIDKVVTLSDYKDLDFGTKYGFLIEELRLLARGVVVIDEQDQVKYVEYVPEAGMEPDYDKALEAVKSI